MRSRGSSWTSTLSGSLIGRAFDNHLKRAKWAAHIGYGNCFVEGGPGAIKIGGSPFKTLAQASDIFFTIASPLVRHAEVVQRDRLTQRARRQRILAIRRGLVDLDVEDEAISLRAGGLHTGPSLALHWRV